MAKAKTPIEEKTSVGSIQEAFKALDKMNPLASFLNEDSLSTVNEWIDTSCYALNAIISGSLYGGVPMGRLTGFIGPESCLTADQTIRTIKYKNVLQDVSEQHAENTTIPEIIELRKQGWELVVESPDGWIRIIDTFENGNKDCLAVTTSQGRTIKCSTEHKLQKHDGTWISAKDLSLGDVLLGKDGSVTVNSVVSLPKQPVFDIKVHSNEHRYWCEDISNHNCGKTLLANKIMANAQKKGMYVAYFDTEGALDEATASRLGCDPSKIKHVPSEIAEHCRNEIVAFLQNIVDLKLQGKVLVVIDSLGNLITAQEKKKIDEGSDTKDMGNRAQSLKSLMRAITHAAKKAKCPVIFTNHIYEDPSQLHPSAIKKQAGGSGPLYMASVTVQMAKKTERAEDSKNKDANDNTTLLSKGINGLTMRAFTTKNRFVTPFLEVEMYLNFRTGLNKYSGLLEMAEGYGVIEKQGHRYALNGETLGFYKDWKDDETVWNKILPLLETKLKKELCFKNENEIDEDLGTDEDDLDESDLMDESLA
jgi:RecA/RadA recombinase